MDAERGKERKKKNSPSSHSGPREGAGMAEMLSPTTTLKMNPWGEKGKMRECLRWGG